MAGMLNRYEEMRRVCGLVQESKKGNEEGQGKWLDGMMKGMEEEMRHNRRDRFFKKMKRLMNSRVTPVDTIVDETGQPVQQAEEKLSR